MTLLIFIGTNLYGQRFHKDSTCVDTGRVRILQDISISTSEYKEIIPSQKLSGGNLKRLNSFFCADAIRYFAGNMEEAGMLHLVSPILNSKQQPT